VTSILSRSALLSMAGAALLLGGCASTDDVKHAQDTADQALAAAHHSQESADSAMSAAQAAQQSVDQLRSQMNSAPPMRHRGEKG
jgi:hypothetical protein